MTEGTKENEGRQLSLAFEDPAHRLLAGLKQRSVRDERTTTSPRVVLSYWP